MHCDFVVQVKCTIFWLNIDLRVNFDLYAQKVPKNPYKCFFVVEKVSIRPIFSTKSMPTDFVVHAKCTICWLNKGLRVYFDLYLPDFQ